jgi:hypothetical protein
VRCDALFAEASAHGYRASVRVRVDSRSFTVEA